MELTHYYKSLNYGNPVINRVSEEVIWLTIKHRLLELKGVLIYQTSLITWMSHKDESQYQHEYPASSLEVPVPQIVGDLTAGLHAAALLSPCQCDHPFISVSFRSLTTHDPFCIPPNTHTGQSAVSVAPVSMAMRC